MDVLTDRLFLGNNAMTAMLLAGIVFYGAAYARAACSPVALVPRIRLGLIADSVVRLLVAAPPIIFASQDLAAAAIALPASEASLPLAVGRKRLGSRFRDLTTPPSALPALGFACRRCRRRRDQVLVNGGPLS